MPAPDFWDKRRAIRCAAAVALFAVASAAQASADGLARFDWSAMSLESTLDYWTGLPAADVLITPQSPNACTFGRSCGLSHDEVTFWDDSFAVATISSSEQFSQARLNLSDYAEAHTVWLGRLDINASSAGQLTLRLPFTLSARVSAGTDGGLWLWSYYQTDSDREADAAYPGRTSARADVLLVGSFGGDGLAHGAQTFEQSGIWEQTVQFDAGSGHRWLILETGTIFYPGISAVPEPSSYGLMLGGLAALLCLGKRRIG